MKEKQKHQEERLRAALERAVAQPKKKVCVLLPIGPATSICECFCGVTTKYLIHIIYPALIGLSDSLLTLRIIQISGSIVLR